jgi:hypothetical protein
VKKVTLEAVQRVMTVILSGTALRLVSGVI